MAAFVEKGGATHRYTHEAGKTTEANQQMFSSAESFDIADLKRSSVRMKGALQAEWQEVIMDRGNASDCAVDPDFIDFNDDQTRAFLPRIDLTLKLNGNNSTVSYVPSLSNLQAQGNNQSNISPLTIAEWAIRTTNVQQNALKFA